MQIPELIRRKRDGQKLSPREIHELVSAYACGEIPDYQASAFLMAVFFRGLDAEELQSLTDAMLHSGRCLNFDQLPRRKVDKHSTGGVGDKTSLIIAPAVAACGVCVPMISGRGLGFTGGTLDKLESIPGFTVDLPLPQIESLVDRLGLALVGQTEELVPADKKLYALRDVTSTVESIPLIVASIMSKKLAEGIDALVLDVKTGTGAFLKTIERSRELGQVMVEVGKRMGKRVVALITDMNQPLGMSVGNSLEVEEALAVLRGEGPRDLTSLCRTLTAHMLHLGEAVNSIVDGESLYDKVIASGKALDRFRSVIEAQGGDPRVIDDETLLPQAANSLHIEASGDGFVSQIKTDDIGMASVFLGAGRQSLDSVIDPAVGIVLGKKVGDEVRQGETLCTLRYNDDTRLEEIARLCHLAFHISEARREATNLVREIIQ